MASVAVVWTVLLGLTQTARAADLTDFSDNLATDLGPLLSLFGEAITKQYLSESTSFEDYIIFALAPIGLMTAVVSVIRVCGGPWLKSFIGRAQEGDVAVEAELCTSTSEDICEVFNRGGITRTLGRAKILEIIRIPQPDDTDEATQNSQSFDTGNKLGSEETSATHNSARAPASNLRSKQGKNVNPNLSINVGRRKQDLPFVNFILVVGVVLQVGLIAMAPLLFWVGGWSVEGRRESLLNIHQAYSANKAPIVFVVGSVFMTLGMFGCASLIGQITKEIKFRRQKDSNGTQLYWVQAGNQVIGDQTFGAYAYSEDSDHRLSEYVISTKRDEDKTVKRYVTFTWVTVVATIGGYIVQFVGIRGMNAWISIAQLAAMLIMSMFRGMMRTQRLKNNGNKIQDISEAVVGHEMDWLTFEI
ncbi:hypothetical protein BS50DRAFT_479546, partial [Corynespora cassiicola Philippines]